MIIECKIALLVFLMLICLIYSPVSLLLLIIVLSIFLKGSEKYIGVLIGLFLGLISMTIEFNNYYPDVVRYYSQYNNDINDALYKMKFYRYIVFSIINYFNFNANVYSFISICTIVIIQFKTALNYLEVCNKNIDSIKNKLLLIVVCISSLPLTMYLSFENVLAFSVVSYGISVHLKKKYLVSYTIFIMACFIHVAAILPVAFIYIAQFATKGKWKKYVSIISYVLCLMFLLYVMNHKVITGITDIDQIFDKVFRYNSNAWAHLTRTEKLYNLPYVFLMFTLFSLAIRSVKDKNVVIVKYFFSFYIIFILFFITNRMVIVRYGLLMPIFFSPLLMLYLCSVKDSLINKTVIFTFFIVCFLSIPNVYIMKKIGNELTFNKKSPFFNTLLDIYNYNTSIPNLSELEKNKMSTLKERS
ncbi:EpsG family protein [Photobacterium sp. GB-3]|uniref:EpsG family protein n=1 Tax=Photobacterium sp. GB-3 TaxID=2022110 RepID=UPI000D15BA8F|nr:EpsG family protein [Photobacterium sp. GB-3]PSV58570.1 hypothetical protein C9J43_04245 [Photobacterium sp. GB-3]